jgi:hypothetical protein
MSMLRNIKSGLRSLFRKELIDQKLNEELGSYLIHVTGSSFVCY